MCIVWMKKCESKKGYFLIFKDQYNVSHINLNTLFWMIEDRAWIEDV